MQPQNGDSNNKNSNNWSTTTYMKEVPQIRKQPRGNAAKCSAKEPKESKNCRQN